uniref:serine/arginine repetitive matrix protein 1-like n=1 Tax=Euleptes europaea TaxID=460621 RepID=UPI00254076C0|nr:serine/arginine repetitive matrix protein 1-like [Euleptes europaea]
MGPVVPRRRRVPTETGSRSHHLPVATPPGAVPHPGEALRARVPLGAYEGQLPGSASPSPRCRRCAAGSGACQARRRLEAARSPAGRVIGRRCSPEPKGFPAGPGSRRQPLPGRIHTCASRAAPFQRAPAGRGRQEPSGKARPATRTCECALGWGSWVAAESGPSRGKARGGLPPRRRRVRPARRQELEATAVHVRTRTQPSSRSLAVAWRPCTTSSEFWEGAPCRRQALHVRTRPPPHARVTRPPPSSLLAVTSPSDRALARLPAADRDPPETPDKKSGDSNLALPDPSPTLEPPRHDAARRTATPRPPRGGWPAEASAPRPSRAASPRPRDPPRRLAAGAPAPSPLAGRPRSYGMPTNTPTARKFAGCRSPGMPRPASLPRTRSSLPVQAVACRGFPPPFPERVQRALPPRGMCRARRAAGPGGGGSISMRSAAPAHHHVKGSLAGGGGGGWSASAGVWRAGLGEGASRAAPPPLRPPPLVRATPARLAASVRLPPARSMEEGPGRPQAAQPSQPDPGQPAAQPPCLPARQANK